MPIWADILLALGAAVVFGLIFAVFFAVFFAALLERAKQRVLQPHFDQLARDLATSRKLTDAARLTIRRAGR